MVSRGKVWIKVCNAKSEGQAKASNTTDLDGGHLSPHLISICQIFRDILKLTSIAGIRNKSVSLLILVGYMFLMSHRF